MAEEDYVSALDHLLTEYAHQIEVVHLCDSTLQQDGLAFGEGSMDMASATQLLKRKFDGILV